MATINKQIDTLELQALELELEEKTLTEQIEALEGRRALVRNKIALIECPFEVGETVVDGRGRKAVVESVYAQSWSSGKHWAPRMVLRKIKADGELYKHAMGDCLFKSWNKAEGDHV